MDFFSLCPYCRVSAKVSDEENNNRIKLLKENGNAGAYHQLAGDYANGCHGLPRDEAKANELYLKAGELGCASGYSNLGYSYDVGRGMEVDKKKAKYFYELAAINGSVPARYNLGVIEGNAENHQRAMKHFMLAAKSGYNDFKKGFTNGFVTKDEYESTLRAYHECQTEVKSEARDKAADILPMALNSSW